MLNPDGVSNNQVPKQKEMYVLSLGFMEALRSLALSPFSGDQWQLSLLTERSRSKPSLGQPEPRAAPHHLVRAGDGLLMTESVLCFNANLSFSSSASHRDQQTLHPHALQIRPR